MKWMVTEDLVLRAMQTAAAPWGGYIVDDLRRRQRAAVSDGATGHPPKASQVLRRCRALEAKGLIECEGGPFGYYGFHWKLTQAGKDRLHEIGA